MSVSIAEPLPDNLRINADGVIYCADGQDLGVYLKRKMVEHAVAPDTSIVLLERASTQLIFDKFSKICSIVNNRAAS